MSANCEVPEAILKYRIRTQIIWYLETASSSERQRSYENGLQSAEAPGNVPDEMINQWEDWVRIDDLAWFSEPEFSREENEAIAKFHKVWDYVADNTPDPMPPTIEDLLGTPIWSKLEKGAFEALQVFMRRGHLLARAQFDRED